MVSMSWLEIKVILLYWINVWNNPEGNLMQSLMMVDTQTVKSVTPLTNSGHSSILVDIISLKICMQTAGLHRVSKFMDCGDVIMGDKMSEWQQQLIYETTLQRKTVKFEIKYPLPEDLIFVHCQAEACVLGKRHSEINDSFVSKG